MRPYAIGDCEVNDDQSVWIGYDSREPSAFCVAKWSIRQFNRNICIRGLVLDELRANGLYWRETLEKINSNGRRQLWDAISNAPMSTEFSISRFLVPHLAKQGWALFVDADVMFRRNVTLLFQYARPDKAVMCVKHNHDPTDEIKMDGQIQTRYNRKNWSSVMLFNCDHTSNKALTLDLINTAAGRDLHGFCWLKDEEVGELPPEWNYLVGHSQLERSDPAIVHFTNGLPNMPGYEHQEYADDWRSIVPYAVGAL